MKIAVLPGDGIGPEIMNEAIKVMSLLKQEGMPLTWEIASIGGAGFEEAGKPLPDATLTLAQQSDAILLGAVGGPQFDKLPREVRPERGLLAIRKALGLFANLRPAIVYPELADASTLKAEVISGLDIMIVRELTGDIYFGEPKGIHTLPNGQREGINTMRYQEAEIRRIGHVAFALAQQRHKKVCSVDKANVLETTELWRQVMEEVARDYPDVTLSHMLVDNAAMQLVRHPKQFDVMVTGNMFGDILSDEASMLTGSIGMLPSASLDSQHKGLYEPCHGSAPDIAGQNKANPLATILSLAMLLRYTGKNEQAAQRIERAVQSVLAQHYRTADIFQPGTKLVSTSEMGNAVVQALTQSIH